MTSHLRSIRALEPRSPKGVQFAQCADVLGGVPGRPDEALFQKAIQSIRRLTPQPEFLLFNGDHVAGYCEMRELRQQWKYFIETECAAFSGFGFPVHHAPGNHDVVSLTENQPNPHGRSFPNSEAEDLFRRSFPGTPGNGPAGQEGLSWHAGGQDHVLVVLHSIPSCRGATGFRDLDWLDAVLSRSEDKEFKIVASHFPVFPVNGYDRHAPYPRASWIIEPGEGKALWDLLVRHKVSAYLCAHVCAFDLQVHENIPQLCSAGAGHHALYPPWAEYHHVAQVCLDSQGFRVQSVDLEGTIRERCEWPGQGVQPPASAGDSVLSAETVVKKAAELGSAGAGSRRLLIRISCMLPAHRADEDQTFLCGWDNQFGPPLFWVGIPAGTSRVEVRSMLFPQFSSCPHSAVFTGPVAAAGRLDMEVLIDRTLGPGGVLCRFGADAPWSSMTTSSPAGFEAWRWPPLWDIAKYQNRFHFLGRDLVVSLCDLP